MKFKRILSLLASAAMAVTAITGAMSVSAEEIVERGECGEKVTWTLYANGKLTISGEGAMATPDSSTIPSGEDRKGDYADTYTYKKYEQNIKEVIIEEGVTTLGFCAFYQMPNIKTVVIPSTITEFVGIQLSPNSSGDDVANYGFAECTSLENVKLTEGMKDLGGYVFYGCTSLEKVTIPKSIKKWSQRTFAECSNLTDVTLTEGLTLITGSAFRNSGIKSIVIPASVEKWAPTNYTNKAEPVLHPNYTNYAFADCSNLTSVTFEEGLKSIGAAAFVNCTALKKVAIPSSVNDMDYSFTGCTGLEEAYIEEGAQISDGAHEFTNAFAYCDNLKRLEIPAGIELDYNNARWCYECSALTDLYIHGQEYGFFPVGNNLSKVHCYSGTKTYNSLISNGVGGIRLEDIQEDMENAQAELNKAVTEAEKYAEEDYTTESYGVLKALLEKAGKYGKDPSVMSMEDTAAGIYAAIDGLIDKSEEPSKPSDSSNPSNPSDNPSDPSNNNPSNNNPTNTKPTTATPKVTPPTVTTVAKPAKVKNVKVTAKKKKLNVSWKKVSGATGYEVQYAANNKFTKNKKSITVKKNKITIKKLKPKKKYFVKVRAYKLANGNKYFGNWSKVVKKKTK